MSYLEAQNATHRFASLGIVMVLHVALIYALVNGLARKTVSAIPTALEIRIIDEVKPVPPERPALTPKLTALPLSPVPVPEVRVESPTPREALALDAHVKPVAEIPLSLPALPKPAAAPVRVSAVVDSRYCDKPEYPPASLRAHETGLVVLQFLIGIDGRAIESNVGRSSGSQRLDEAARHALALCRFRPGTVDGVPVQSWARIDYRWTIED